MHAPQQARPVPSAEGDQKTTAILNQVLSEVSKLRQENEQLRKQMALGGKPKKAKPSKDRSMQSPRCEMTRCSCRRSPSPRARGGRSARPLSAPSRRPLERRVEAERRCQHCGAAARSRR
mmetsp:Transcript_34717/g.77671  ORF Transcript_34717/g.77671 Transcript_34717/m.77671 type:complete len:120 (-) Transcript_34717:64-423(-)